MKVTTNFVVSLDGKTSTVYREHIPPSKADGKMMRLYRRKADAILIGAQSLRVYREPRPCGRKNSPSLNLVLARKLNFDITAPFFISNEIERVFFVPKNTSRQSMKKFEHCCQFVFFDPKKSYPKQVLKYLQARGIETLLIEGGGGITFPWAKENLIDEWNITLAPKIVGGKGGPTMVEGEGFTAKQLRHYHLKKCRRIGDELFLTYSKNS